MLGASIAGLLAAPRGARAAWPLPGRPVTLIVPYAPGGGVDTSARMIAAGLEREFAAPVQVLNRPGAGSQIGATELVRARPDGHTLLWAVLPTLITHYLDPARQARYTRADFQPVALHHVSPVVFAVRAASPYRSLRDLVEAARAAPEAITISTSGLMATPHIGILMLQAATGARFTAVHFTGGPPSVTALVGGHVDVVAGGSSDVVTQFAAGSFRVLGTTGEAPEPLLPGVPTFRAQGYDVVVASAGGMLAPAGTPMEIVGQIAEAMRRIMAEPAYAERMRQFGLDPIHQGPAAYAAYWARDEARMRPIMAAMAGG
jgi:tripartite-type tricarboxylate transporter receptor subunit TctC